MTLVDEVMNQNLPLSELGLGVFLLSDILPRFLILTLTLTPLPFLLPLALPDDPILAWQYDA